MIKKTFLAKEANRVTLTKVAYHTHIEKLVAKLISEDRQ